MNLFEPKIIFEYKSLRAAFYAFIIYFSHENKTCFGAWHFHQKNSYLFISLIKLMIDITCHQLPMAILMKFVSVSIRRRYLKLLNVDKWWRTVKQQYIKYPMKDSIVLKYYNREAAGFYWSIDQIDVTITFIDLALGTLGK